MTRRHCSSFQLRFSNFPFLGLDRVMQVLCKWHLENCLKTIQRLRDHLTHLAVLLSNGSISLIPLDASSSKEFSQFVEQEILVIELSERWDIDVYYTTVHYVWYFIVVDRSFDYGWDMIYLLPIESSQCQRAYAWLPLWFNLVPIICVQVTPNEHNFVRVFKLHFLNFP